MKKLILLAIASCFSVATLAAPNYLCPSIAKLNEALQANRDKTHIDFKDPSSNMTATWEMDLYVHIQRYPKATNFMNVEIRTPAYSDYNHAVACTYKTAPSSDVPDGYIITAEVNNSKLYQGVNPNSWHNPEKYSCNSRALSECTFKDAKWHSVRADNK